MMSGAARVAQRVANAGDSLVRARTLADTVTSVRQL